MIIGENQHVGTGSAASTDAALATECVVGTATMNG
jgi:hypothetical protein